MTKQGAQGKHGNSGKYRVMGVLLVAASLISGSAVAQDLARPGYPDSRMRLGLNVVPAPFGTVKTEVAGVSTSTDLALAFGVRAFFDYLITPNFFIGFGPTYVFNIKTDNDDSSGTALDLLLRLGGNAPVSDTVQLYGYLSPGYSIVMPPEGADAKGLALGLQAGAMYSLSRTAFLNGELGYQIGFHSRSFLGTDVDTKFSYMQIALGGGIRL